MGAITPVGNDVATTWQSLIEGKSGTAPITKFDASKFPVRVAAEVKGFNPLDYMDRKEAKRADQYTQYAIAGARQAMTDAKLIERNGMDPDRIGVIIGSGIGGL
jgi:3-oxoacyl-[acyl-carrier-protein] synthase II